MNKDKVELSKDIWLILLPFLGLLFSLIYSYNVTSGINLLIKMLSFIIMPIIFYLNKRVFKKENILNILYLFSFSVLILVIYQLGKVFLNLDFILQDLTLNEVKVNGYSSVNDISKEVISRIKLRRFRNYVITISNTHTTYQGMWISFVVFFLGFQVKKSKKLYLKIACTVSAILLLIWLYLISARMPLLALIISGSLTVFMFSNYSRKKNVKIILLLLGLGFVLLSFKNPFSIRVKEYYNTGLTLLEKQTALKEYNSSNVRNGIYYCDFRLVSDNFLFGVGVGDVQDELNKCYYNELGSEVYKWREYNTHNQYLFFFISNGIFGFLGFICVLIYLIKSAIQDKNFIYFYFIVSVCFIFITENVLVRSDGVLFFSFFSSLFLFNSKKEIS